jgi:AraC family transcriptional regulator
MYAQALQRASRPTLEEWYSEPIIQVLKSSELLGWEPIRLRYTYLRPTTEPLLTPHSEQYAIIMLLEGSTRIRANMAAEKPFDQILRPGATQIVPPQVEGSSTWDTANTAAFLEFSPHLLHRLADEMFRGDPYRAQLSTNFNFHDSLVHVLMRKLCDELNASNPHNSLYVESLTHTMILHLLKGYAKLTRVSTRSQHRLTVGQIRIIEDYIDSNFSERISLSDMADLLHISVSHFERIFHTSFDRPPYQYVIRRRVERAKQLLSGPYLSLHDVARLCGFADQSHLTRHFTRLVGVTPAHFARHSRH